MTTRKASSNMNEQETRLRSRKIMLCSIAVMLIAVVFNLLLPEQAHADGNSISMFSAAIGAINNILTNLMLPIAIAICAWKLIYIAVFCGLIGVDPFNIMDKAGADMSSEAIKAALIKNMRGFVIGLCWVGGLFVIFKLALWVAGAFAGIFERNFA